MKFASTTLVFCVASLLALGMVMLYSSSMADKGAQYLLLQSIWCGLGLTGALVAASVDYRILKRLAWPLFGLAVLLLALVLVPHIGSKINGARRWFKEPHTGLRFEPSALGKLAIVVVLAWYGDRYQRQMRTLGKGIAAPGLIAALILGLIIVEPDAGTTILLASVTGAMLLVAGARWVFILPLATSVIAGFGLFLWYSPMRRARIFAWRDVETHKLDVALQAKQAMLAFASGGWFGRGLGESREKLGFLPEHHTDFIFPIIGEELGLVATLAVVLAFLLLVACGLYIASRAADTFGMLLATGISCLIGLQAVINIAVVTNTVPNKGLPLPFISYGGSDLLVMLVSIGLLLSIARQAPLTESADGPIEPGLVPSPQLS